jgi:hypothetical protein
VGSPLTGPFFSTLTCGDVGGCTWANTALAEAGANVTSPISGVIVRWRMAGSYLGTFKLRVLRPSGGGQYTGAGTSSPVDTKGTTTQTFTANLPIQAGDLIGIDYGNGKHLATAEVTGSAFGLWAPALADSAMGAPSPSAPNLEVLFNADVQPPPGITTLSPTQGSIAGGTPVLITGHDFSEASAVNFGTVPATSFRVDSETQITAVSPPGSQPGAVDISATTAAGTTAANVADQFTYTACVVPKLKGKSLRADRKRLKKAGCKLGKVRGDKSKSAKVKKQSAKPGKVLPPGSKVNVKVA